MDIFHEKNGHYGGTGTEIWGACIAGWRHWVGNVAEIFQYFKYNFGIVKHRNLI